ncbi:uncharacterized protein EV154DRAFT_488318 [Mucor mucedo]|uniref:uncharacterized protein n=1 Tax=Mucor mucedo TaxID=29922 RepID=UPI00222056D5|nr:uncharacterized protein EV154DRAFT_488318 [Mucor mucedo]KAI7867477.1 hypothetical protein EV154DRAFT_488318 [Mucor mucedo]
METSLINRLLPKEIMHLIVGHLASSVDIKSYRLVCSDWNSTIWSMFYKDGISIFLTKQNYQKLQDDFLKFPESKMKIQKMYIVFDKENSFRDFWIYLNILMPMIAECKNIRKLHFISEKLEPYHLSPLLIETVDLPCIEEIITHYPVECNPSLRQAYFNINFKYRNTITHLRINNYIENATYSHENCFTRADMETKACIDSNLSHQKIYDFTYKRKWDYYSGIVDYVNNFRNLKCLSLQLFGSDIIDITILTETNLPQLETLEIYGMELTLFIENPPSHWSKLNSCASVTDLKLDVREFSVNTLEYFMTWFTNVEKLSIFHNYSMKNYRNSSYGKEETPALIQKLISYCTGIKYVRGFILYNVFEGETKIRRNIFRQNGQWIDEIREPDYYLNDTMSESDVDDQYDEYMSEVDNDYYYYDVITDEDNTDDYGDDFDDNDYNKYYYNENHFHNHRYHRHYGPDFTGGGY